MLLLTFKALNDIAPDDLFDILKLRKKPHSLRSETKLMLDVPRTRTCTNGDRAFSVCAPTLWNALLVEIRFETELFVFKTKLKTQLFEKF